MEEETPKNWLDELIIRQALPEEIREGTNTDFCIKWGISESTYYYQASKPENQEKIVNLALQNTKKHAPEVLENLAVRAKNNSKDAEMYLKFILQLTEKIDSTINLKVGKLEEIQSVLKNIANGENKNNSEQSI